MANRAMQLDMCISDRREGEISFATAAGCMQRGLCGWHEINRSRTSYPVRVSLPYSHPPSVSVTTTDVEKIDVSNVSPL